MPTNEILEIKDLKGIRMLHIASLTTDNQDELTYETPIRFAGAQEVSSESEEDSASKYYDNVPAIVNDSEGADTYSISCSVVPDKVRAVIDGRKFDEETGAYYGTPKKKPYLAFGFIGMHTNGKEYAYWIYKGKMSGGGETYATKDDGTDSNGQEYEYTSVYTDHKFQKADSQPLKFWKIPLEKTSEAKWFAQVITPDTFTAEEVVKAKVEEKK